MEDGLEEAGLIREDSMVLVEGSIDNSRDANSVHADRLITFDEAPEVFGRYVRINMTAAGTEEDTIEKAEALFKQYRGDKPVFFVVKTHDSAQLTIECSREYRVRPSGEFLAKAAELFGDGRVALET